METPSWGAGVLAEWAGTDSLSSVVGSHDGGKEPPCVLHMYNSNSTIKVILKPKYKVTKTVNMKLRITDDSFA